MKTKEFIKKVKELGYNIQREDRTKHKSIYITIPDDETEGETETTIADLSTTWEAWGTLHQMEFSGHNEIELMRVMADYLETPLEEREEPKKYRVELKTTDSTLILWKATDGSGDTDFININRVTTGQKFFTKQEIKDIDPRYLSFAKEVSQ